MGVVAILVMWPGQFKHIFVSANPEGYIWNMTTIGLLAFEKMFENEKLMVVPGSKVKERPWPFLPTNLHLLIKTTLLTIFMPKSSKLPMKSYVLAFSHIWSCCKKVKVTLRSSFEQSWLLRYPMLHTRFQSHWFWRRRFFKGFTIYGHGNHFDHVTLLICIYFFPIYPWAFIRNLVQNDSIVSEKNKF